MPARRPRVLWVLAALGPLLLAGSTLALLTHRVPGTFDVDNVYPNLVFGGAMPLLGALVLSRRSRHPIGLLFLACGLASAVTIAVYSYAEYGLVLHPGALPGALFAAWVSSWVWGLGFVPLMTLGVLLFPDGRLPGPRWRAVAVLDVVVIALFFLVNAFRPGPLQNHPVADNPVGVPAPSAALSVVGGATFALLVVGLLSSVFAVLVRWRRGDSVARSQIGWFATAVVLEVVAVLLPVHEVGAVLTLVATPLLPVSVAVAVLRRDLYGIDVVVRRSLVYGALTAGLLAVYALVVLLLGSWSATSGGSAAPLLGTAVVAVAFAPARARLQRSAQRLVYGAGNDPYAVLTDLGRRLEAAGDEDRAPLTEVATSVADSLRLPYARVEVGRVGEPVLTGEYGPTPADPAGLVEVPLAFRDERVGRLVASPRTPRDPFRAADLRLLEDLGRQIGVAAHAMLLSADLQTSREQLVTLREEERRRIRRDLHDGLGPALAGVALGLDAVERIVTSDAGGAARLARELKGEVQESLTDVRRLVEDLRPPDLDQLGLVVALRRHAERVTSRDPGLVVEVTADGVDALPAAVEVAAYRIAVEAVTNVARHASARHCCVEVRRQGGALRVVVEDDGVGPAGAGRAGTGLTAMRERATELGGTCALGATARGGTRVEARLPVGTP